MYRTLFDLAGLAILGWLPLILLPGWRWTRRLAESALFPAYLSVLYAVGIAAVLAELGPGMMGDFGSADGVLALLRTEGLALVAWIHILAFDHAIGILIYRDNMRHRFVPVPLQSVILLLTLMFGPVGFLTYWLARATRPAQPLVAWGERWDPPRRDPSTDRAVRFDEVVGGGKGPRAWLALLRREPAVTAVGLLGIALAGWCALAAALNGGWTVPPEGRLDDALRFELGSGIYMLTLAVLLPFAGFAPRKRRLWVRTFVTVSVYFLGIEAVQATRGLDPRFSAVGGPLDQAAGLLFGLSALLMIGLSAVLFARFFRGEVLEDRPELRMAIRWGALAIALSFGVGLAMSALRGRFVGEAGSLMPLHAAGLHGIQAVPLIALLAGTAGAASTLRIRLTQVAGAGWLLLCIGLLGQALAGAPPLSAGPWNVLALTGAAAWTSAAGVAGLGWAQRRYTDRGPVTGSP